MRHETRFLKFAVILIGLPVLAWCILALPKFTHYFAVLMPRLAYLEYPFFAGFCVTAVFYFAALHQALKLLNYIDENQAFSERSVTSLKKIKYCAIAIGALYTLFMPLFYLMADADDAPGLIIVVLVIIFGCVVVAVFAAVLQKLLKNAIDIKSENDLTV
ncbi:DUF2975 domain-containing protein [Sporolactobacillus sp. CPB3-1]|uniref:DUF2975 domain-containing protein n=1 Tax=Sporolactobacillus mangiferae TaxID=2940498 RepID=A0ABT0M7C7_9BACL|nr:DUF2975 domain-containing protein [Sporolactobacillus mangiferae]MCL1630764.1 DUF2975 domain-containing protein [Sporolactobacillus mangiferae]